MPTWIIYIFCLSSFYVCHQTVDATVSSVYFILQRWNVTCMEGCYIYEYIFYETKIYVNITGLMLDLKWFTQTLFCFCAKLFQDMSSLFPGFQSSLSCFACVQPTNAHPIVGYQPFKMLQGFICTSNVHFFFLQ